MTTAEIIALLGLILAFVGMVGGLMIMWGKLNIQISEIKQQSSLGLKEVANEGMIRLEGVRKEVDLRIQGIHSANQIRVEGLRNEMDIHVDSIKDAATQFSTSLTDRLKTFIDDNQKDHKEIKDHLKGIKYGKTE